MKVRMLATAAGPQGVFPAQTEAEVDEDLARVWIAQGFCLPVTVANVRPAPHLTGVEHALDAGALGAEQRMNGETAVTAIDGIGPVTAQLLAEANIHTLAQLLDVDVAMLAMLARTTTAKAEKWRQRAAAVMGV